VRPSVDLRNDLRSDQKRLSENVFEVHSRNHVPRSSTDPMTSKFLRVLLACAVTLTFSALAQTGSATTPAAPAASSPAATPAPNSGTKVGAINVEGAVFGSNEGQRELDTLQKKFEPKRNELKGQQDELDGLKKQLTNTQEKLNEDALATLKSRSKPSRSFSIAPRRMPRKISAPSTRKYSAASCRKWLRLSSSIPRTTAMA